MLGRALRWLTGKPEARTDAPGGGPRGEPSFETPDDSARRTPAPAPVFSSRAVRDAAVVTAAVEAIGRFAEGTESLDDLVHRLTGLTAEQMGFLQLSAESPLVLRALARLDEMKGVQIGTARKLLSQLAASDHDPTGALPGSLFSTPGAAPVVPAPRSVVDEPALMPSPPPRPPSTAVPRLPRSTVEQRRARLIDAFTDQLPAPLFRNEASR